MTKANQPKDSPPDIYLTNQKQAQQLYDKNRLKDTDSLDDELREICTYHKDNGWSGYDLTDEQFDKILALFKSENNRVLQTVLELPPAHLIGSNGRRSEYIKTSDVQDLIHRIMEG